MRLAIPGEDSPIALPLGNEDANLIPLYFGDC